ncbi:MAG: Shikimate kinase I, partial [uncultured Nocardioidaceae bacterium]
ARGPVAGPAAAGGEPPRHAAHDARGPRPPLPRGGHRDRLDQQPHDRRRGRRGPDAGPGRRPPM